MAQSTDSGIKEKFSNSKEGFALLGKTRLELSNLIPES